MKEVKDNFQAFLVEDAKFVSKEEYPLLEEWMISESHQIRLFLLIKLRKLKTLKNIIFVFIVVMKTLKGLK